MPVLSIITITYNAEEFLERTLRSILAQTDQDFEYLLIDGGSKDRTLAVAAQYKSRINVLISEPDRGLYDAMNKGQAKASGQYVWFMNAGDEIAEPDAVAKIKELAAEGADVIYSDTFMVYQDRKVLGLRSELTPHRWTENLSWKNYRYGMLICHQSFIASKSIVPEYSLQNLSADIDWEITCLKRAGRIMPYPGILARYLLGGISQQQHRRSLQDRYRVLQKHFGLIPNLWNHLYIVLRGLMQKIK
jgi:glycosyltransferase involved in cell wall biosynthesis